MTEEIPKNESVKVVLKDSAIEKDTFIKVLCALLLFEMLDRKSVV